MGVSITLFVLVVLVVHTVESENAWSVVVWMVGTLLVVYHVQ